jgi:uncharacterized protein YecT (DUF1311 family)
MTRSCILLLAASSLLATPAPADETWYYHEPVKYKDGHDPHLIDLVDGRKLSYVGGTLTLDEMLQWPPGKDLVLAYRGDVGTILVDPSSQKYFAIVGGLEEQPIDILLEECLEAETNWTTRGMMQCHGAARDRWDQELNRVYQQLMASLDRDAREALKAAQRQWIRFRDQQVTAIGAIYYGPGSGTLGRVQAAHQVMELTRTQALRLVTYLGR